MEVSLSPDIILCGLTGLKGPTNQLTNQPANRSGRWKNEERKVCFCLAISSAHTLHIQNYECVENGTRMRLNQDLHRVNLFLHSYLTTELIHVHPKGVS